MTCNFSVDLGIIPDRITIDKLVNKETSLVITWVALLTIAALWLFGKQGLALFSTNHIHQRDPEKIVYF